MKPKHTILVFAAVLVVAASILVPLLAGPALAEDSSGESNLLDSLERQGVRATSVEVQGDVLQVLLPSVVGVTDDAWARTIAIREAAFLAEAGQMTARSLGLSLIDEKGTVVYRYESLIEPRKRPVAGEGPAANLESLQVQLAAETKDKGVTLNRLDAVCDPGQGLIVESESVLESVESIMHEEQLRWATLGFLSRLRELCESSGMLAPDLYRLSVKDGSGKLLVSYVVEPDVRAARVWASPAIVAVWR